MLELRKQAEELGIAVDGRWSEDRLRKEIDAALEKPAEQAEPKTSVILKYDVWDADGKRIPAGPDPVKLPVSLARAILNAGKAERADPLPGEGG